MISATTFTFNNIFSGNYGLLIAEIESNSLQSSTPFTYTVNSVKTPSSKRFSITGIETSEMATKQFSIYSADGSPLSDIVQRDILNWLIDESNDDFKRLEIHQSEYENYYFNCVFNEISKEFHNGFCVGLTLTASFDSIYGYGTPRKKTIKSDGADWVEMKFINDSDIQGYSYPVIKFKQHAPIADTIRYDYNQNSADIVVTDEPCSVVIVNTSDKANPSRAFIMGELGIDEQVEIDCELKLISTTDNSISNTSDKLNIFNKNWLRLLPKVNNLQIRINGEISIEMTPYIKIGL